MATASKFPDYLLQEVRNLLCTRARDMVFKGRGDGENTAGQEAMMSNVFHGSPGYASVLDEMMQGKGIYASMFDKVPIENNREGNENRQGGHMLVAKDIFSCDEGSKFIVHAKGFVRDALAKNGDEMISGRNIKDRANNSIGVYKFALKYCDEYMDDSGTGKYPSGKGFEDMVLYVRQKVYVHLKGGKNNKGANRRAAKDGKEWKEENMPDKYMFNGFFVFLMYGPVGLAGSTLTCLSADGKKVERVGRAEARKKESEVKQAERTTGVGATGIFQRGVPVKDKFACAQMAVSQYKEAKRNVVNLLFHNNAAETNCIAALSEINKMIDRAEDRNDGMELRMLNKRKQDVLGRWDKLSTRKTELEEECDQLMKQSPSRQVSAYYESVGMPNVPSAVAVSNKSQEDDESSITNVPGTANVQRTASTVRPVVAIVPRPQLPSHCSQLSQEVEVVGTNTNLSGDTDEDVAETEEATEEDDLVEVVPRELQLVNFGEEDEGEESSSAARMPKMPNMTLTGFAANFPPEIQQMLLRQRLKDNGIDPDHVSFQETAQHVAQQEGLHGRDGTVPTNYQPGGVYHASYVSAGDGLTVATANQWFAQEEEPTQK
ncbi:unknown protein [Seminavis robusta]|uniref:Uncharacterized protein n=1 Tax=Seminavis robusta TaxID=568900 RepID=A0A9N8F3D0_9STRA|nr:unknown protein [Seminavis robusta]|eukprot:Sro3065_g343080.1 n/a (603) ;mRNA; f:1615-3502